MSGGRPAAAAGAPGARWASLKALQRVAATSVTVSWGARHLQNKNKVWVLPPWGGCPRGAQHRGRPPARLVIRHMGKHLVSA